MVPATHLGWRSSNFRDRHKRGRNNRMHRFNNTIAKSPAKSVKPTVVAEPTNEMKLARLFSEPSTEVSILGDRS